MNEPMLTKEEYLAAFETWIAVRRGAFAADTELQWIALYDEQDAAWREAVTVADLPGSGPVSAFCAVLAPALPRTLNLTTGKSALLARLLYAREPLRTTKCLEHEGVWSGIEWSDNRCSHGCGLTGWLPAGKA